MNSQDMLNGVTTAQKQMVYCMRHGSTALDDLHRSDGYLDLPLSSEGNQGVVETLDYLKHVPITCIYAAPLLWTQETAHILQTGIATHPEIETSPEALTWDLGTMSGDPKDPNKDKVRDLLQHPDQVPDGGESYDDFTSTFDPWFEKMQDDSKTEGPLLLILSGSNIRRISEQIMHDRAALNVGEAGLFVLYPEPGGQWTAQIITGDSADQDEDS
jgi:broad specificity phosphatase PhoE